MASIPDQFSPAALKQHHLGDTGRSAFRFYSRSTAHEGGSQRFDANRRYSSKYTDSLDRATSLDFADLTPTSVLHHWVGEQYIDAR